MLLWPDAALAFYADSRTTVRSPGTRATWAFAYRGLQRIHPGRHLAGFTPDHLVAFLNRAHDPTGRGWAPGTVRTYRAGLRSLFSWAYWAGHVAVDPTVRLYARLRVPSGAIRTPLWLDDSQIADLLATLGDAAIDHRDRVVLLAGLAAGLRTGEICAMDWHELDLARHYLRVRRKGGRIATVALAPQLAAAINRWRQAIATSTGTDPYGLAHPVVSAVPQPRLGFSGQRLSTTQVRAIVRRRGEQAGIRGLCPHDLRRSLAGYLARTHVPLTDIRDILGHHSVATTERYLATDPHRAVRTIQGLNLPERFQPDPQTAADREANPRSQ